MNIVGDDVHDVPLRNNTMQGAQWRPQLVGNIFKRSAVERKQIKLKVQSKRACERSVNRQRGRPRWDFLEI